MRATIRNLAVAAAILMLFAGCVTPINWRARVGHYTYDQAVRDYGPPDRFARLSDGDLVAQWMTQRSEVIMNQGPCFSGPGYFGPMWGGYSSSYFPAHFLRLEFSAGGKLKTWKEFSK